MTEYICFSEELKDILGEDKLKKAKEQAIMDIHKTISEKSRSERICFLAESNIHVDKITKT